MKQMPIAIVGWSSLYPGTHSPDDIWQSVQQEQHFIRDMPDSRLHGNVLFDRSGQHTNRVRTLKGGFIDEFEFPFKNFRIPPRDLSAADVSQRVLLDLCDKMLKDFGKPLSDEDRMNTAVILGNSGLEQIEGCGVFVRRRRIFHYLRPLLRRHGWDDTRIGQVEQALTDMIRDEVYDYDASTAAIGSITPSIPGRLALTFGFGGFHHVVDAACASSLAAINLGIASLLTGESKYVIAGGFDLMLTPLLYTGFSLLDALSPDHSSPFDASANGLVQAEGAGIFLLKRLDDALDDDDPIHAVIMGMGSSSDGKGKAIYAPDPKGIARAMTRSFEITGLNPADVQMVEAHATSTPVGDAAEFDAIAEAYGSSHSAANPLRVASSKEQIGHSRAASSMPAIIRAVQGMKHGTFPHMFTFKSMNPRVTYQGDAVKVSSEKGVPWPEQNAQRMAGVTSAGFGGITYHALIQHRQSYSVPSAERRRVSIAPLAIVAMATDLPHGHDDETIARRIAACEDTYVDIPEDSLRWQMFGKKKSEPDTDRNHSRRIAPEPDIDFNPLKYKIVPAQAEQLDPAQRHAIWLMDTMKERYPESFTDTDKQRVSTIFGYLFNHRRQEVIEPIWMQVYIDMMRRTLQPSTLSDDQIDEIVSSVATQVIDERPKLAESSIPGWMMNTLAGRVSKAFDLQGPNYTCDSACASSLAALHSAMLELAMNWTDLVITGGINIGSSDDILAALSALKAISVTDPKPFDVESDGFLMGQGGALIAVRRLDDAMKRGDKILAVVDGMGAACERQGRSLISASPETIGLSIDRALRQSQFAGHEVQGVEAHGGGTAVGDAAEVKAFAEHLTERREPVMIGSIKSHAGHMQGGASAAGLAAIILGLQRNTFYGLRKLNQPNPKFDEFADKAHPVRGPQPLRGDNPAVALNSLGLGGSSFFAIVSKSPHPSYLLEKESKPGNATPLETTPVAQSLNGHGLFYAGAPSLDELVRKLTEWEGSAPTEQGSPSERDSVSLACTYSDSAGLQKKLALARKMIGNPASDKALLAQGIFVRRGPKL